jgi:uncharacterized DUF497 family protein
VDFLRIIWDDENDPTGNVQHIAEHGVSVEEVEEVLANSTSEGLSASSGLPCVWGYTLEEIYLIVIYERIDEDSIRVVTAYEVPEPN